MPPLFLRTVLWLAALTGEKEDWRRNRLGKWYANGVATPVQQRAAVIELKSRSEADRAAGRRGKTWDEIADEVGGPTKRTCQRRGSFERG